MTHLIRERMSFVKFLDSGEVPPLDPEQYIAWKYQKMLITENEAMLALAEHRRRSAEQTARVAELQRRYDQLDDLQEAIDAAEGRLKAINDDHA